MSNISQFLASTAIVRPVSLRGPGSNGFWRRRIFNRPGTFTWVAAKDGKIKIQGIGSASGGCKFLCGASGCYGDKILSVSAGQTITLIIGGGGAPAAVETALSTPGGSTSISGTPIGGTPLVLPGAAGVRYSALEYGAPAVPTGPWDTKHNGAVPVAINTGSPASASPFGPGVANPSGVSGGGGWGGPASGPAGASSWLPGLVGQAAPGLKARAGSNPNFADVNGGSEDFWDLSDIDGGGGMPGLSNMPGGYGGVGAGGGASGTSMPGGISPLGGGTGRTSGRSAPKSGFGAGGGATDGENLAGAGGDAFVLLFWDEVL